MFLRENAQASKLHTLKYESVLVYGKEELNALNDKAESRCFFGRQLALALSKEADNRQSK